MSNSAEIYLSSPPYHAVVSPFGASLRQCWVETPSGRRDIVWGYSGTENKKGGQGDVLVPFPGRIRAGRYRFDGKDQQLEKNDKEGPNAIHGFVRTRSWEVKAETASASFETRIDAAEFSSKGYPFSLEVQVRYSLSADGLTCQCDIRNRGSTPAPIGAGFHPYFTAGTVLADEALLEIPAQTMIEFDDGLLPTGRVLPVKASDVDFTTLRPIGNIRLNHCFGDFTRNAEGVTLLYLRHPDRDHGLRLWMDNGFSYLVAYTGDALGPNARSSIALEPMSCATDAFNHPEWGLTVLAPSEAWTGRWGVAREESKRKGR